VKATTESLAQSIPFLPSLGPSYEAYHDNGIDFTAGTELWQRYDDLLTLLHENQVALAAQAEATDQRVKPLLERCNAQYRAINALYKELWTLPKVFEGLTHFQQSLRTICESIDDLEGLLATRTAEVEALELERWKAVQQQKLEEYRLLKRAELQRLEKEMQAKKKQLEKELQKSEEQARRKLEEEEEKYRQACEAAFRHSMEEFKKYGPQRIPRTHIKESLEQISLGAVNDSELEQFLGSDDEDGDDFADDLLGGDDEERDEDEDIPARSSVWSKSGGQKASRTTAQTSKGVPEDASTVTEREEAKGT